MHAHTHPRTHPHTPTRTHACIGGESGEGGGGGGGSGATGGGGRAGGGAGGHQRSQDDSFWQTMLEFFCAESSRGPAIKRVFESSDLSLQVHTLVDGGLLSHAHMFAHVCAACVTGSTPSCPEQTYHPKRCSTSTVRPTDPLTQNTTPLDLKSGYR